MLPGATLTLSCMLLFILAWNFSWSGLMLTIASEVLPQPVRGLGTGLVYAIYWLLSFVVSQTLETTFEVVGESATFAFYGITTACALCFAWKCVPETNGTKLVDGESKRGLGDA